MCVSFRELGGGGFGGPWYFRRSCKRACQQKCSRKAMLCSKQLDVIWECIRALQLHNEPCSLRECTALFKTAANTLRQCTFTPASPFNIWVLHINEKNLTFGVVFLFTMSFLQYNGLYIVSLNYMIWKINFSVCLHAVSTAGTLAFSMTKHPHFLVIFNSLYSPLASVPSCKA